MSEWGERETIVFIAPPDPVRFLRSLVPRSSLVLHAYLVYHNLQLTTAQLDEFVRYFVVSYLFSF